MSGRKALPNQTKSPVRARQAINQSVDLSAIESDIVLIETSVTALEAADVVLDTRIDALEAFDLTLQDLAFLDTVNNSQWLGTDLSVANGGTGASDAAGARTNLGLIIGTNVQAQDAELQAIAGLTSAADRLPYFTGLGTAALAVFTTFGRSIVDDADATAARTTLGLGTAATQNTGTSGATIPFLNGANTWSAIQTFSVTPNVANNIALNVVESGGTARSAIKMDTSNNMEYGNVNNNGEYLNFTHNFSAGGVASKVLIDSTGITVAGVVTATGTGSSSFAGPITMSTTSPYIDIYRTSGVSDVGVQFRTGSRYDRILNTSSGMYFGYNYSGSEKTMLWNGTVFTIDTKTAARVTSGTSANSGLISWGTAAPGALAVGEMYLRHA